MYTYMYIWYTYTRRVQNCFGAYTFIKISSIYIRTCTQIHIHVYTPANSFKVKQFLLPRLARADLFRRFTRRWCFMRWLLRPIVIRLFLPALLRSLRYINESCLIRHSSECRMFHGLAFARSSNVIVQNIKGIPLLGAPSNIWNTGAFTRVTTETRSSNVSVPFCSVAKPATGRTYARVTFQSQHVWTRRCFMYDVAPRSDMPLTFCCAA